MEIDFEKFIPRFNSIVDRGLSHGVGARDGQMCIEAAVCAALDLPHGDDPKCVAAAVRTFKIALNDKTWPSPQARANGLRKLGIAQVGSLGVVNDVEFVKRLAEKTTRVLIPRLFRELAKNRQDWLDAADRCEKEGTRESALGAQKVAQKYSAYAASAAAAAAYADAASAAASAAAASAAAASYLTLSADLALEVLIELNSPGAKYVTK